MMSFHTPLQIKADKQIYTLEVVLKTSYQFVNDAYLHLSQDDNSWIISWINKPGSSKEPGNFENELIAQQLRYQLLEKTSDIRKMMLARAFASTVIDTNRELETKAGESLPEYDEETEKHILEEWFHEEDRV